MKLNTSGWHSKSRNSRSREVNDQVKYEGQGESVHSNWENEIEKVLSTFYNIAKKKSPKLQHKVNSLMLSNHTSENGSSRCCCRIRFSVVCLPGNTTEAELGNLSAVYSSVFKDKLIIFCPCKDINISHSSFISLFYSSWAQVSSLTYLASYKSYVSGSSRLQHCPICHIAVQRCLYFLI